MKVGAENKTKLWVSIVLLVLAAYMLARTLGGTGAQTAANPAAGPAAQRSPQGQRPVISTLDPTLRTDLLQASERQEYAAGKRNIFESQSSEPEAEIPQPVAPAVTARQEPPAPPQPTIDLKFFGFASRPGEPKKVFLSSGEDVFIGSEGEIVNRRYKIERIGNTSVEVFDILNNLRQTIPLTQG